MSDQLQPGDLCVVVDHPSIKRYRWAVGKTVVLVSSLNYGHPLYDPYWQCAGAPGVGVSFVCLRKIPPPPLEAEQFHGSARLPPPNERQPFLHEDVT